MKKLLGAGIAVLLVVLAVLAYPRLREEPVAAVQAIVVEKGDLQSSVKATGVVTSRQDVAIVAPVSGTITSALPEVGQSVRKGGSLVRIDSRDAIERLRNAQAALAAADEEVKQQRRTYESLEKVWAAGAEARRNVDDALSSLNIAIARRAKVDADVKGAGVGLEMYSIPSPISGLVTSVAARRGQYTPAGKVLLNLVETDNVQLKVKVDQSAAHLIRVGESVELSTESQPGVIAREKIVQIEPAIQKDGATDILVAWVSLSPGLDLRLEQQVDVKIRTADKRAVLKIPFEAIASNAGKDFVRVVDHGRLRHREILTGIQDSREIEVVKGLAEGELVVLPAAGKPLKEGDRVQPEMRPRA
jgi:RND family efflux transporter MFP subunit